MLLTSRLTSLIFSNLAPKRFFPSTFVLRLAPKESFSTSQTHHLQDIIETTSADGKITEIEAVKLDLPTGKTLRLEGPTGVRSILDDNDFFRLLSHTDVLILRQFLNSDYTLLPTEVTGLKPYQHRRIEQLIKKAQRANLIPRRVRELRDTVPFRDELKFGLYDHNKVNTYYEDWDPIY